MRLSLRSAGAVALALAVGCGGESSAPDETSPPTGISGPNASIEFSDDSTLALTPGELISLTIETEPPDHYEVTFLLLGDSLDATLDQSVVVAGADGRATVTLRAPNQTTTFRVKASIKDGPSAELPVSVSDAGFGTLRVVPVYAGLRDVTEWTAAAVAKRTCAEIAGDLPNDPPGALEAKAPGDGTPEIELAPVGPNLAVTLRAGHYIWGCADETGLDANETLDVRVTVFDKPLDLSVTDLAVDFAFDAAEDTYDELLVDGAVRFAEGAFPSATPEWQTLLDAMQMEIEDDADLAAFTAARAATFDTYASTHFGGISPTLHDALLTWASAGVLAQPASLSGRLQAMPDQLGHAVLTFEAFGNGSAGEAGLPAQHVMSWSAQPGDVVLLGGTIFWQPSRLAGSAAAAPAVAAYPTAANVTEALDAAVDCVAFAGSLGGFGGCDVTCTAELCGSGLAARYEAGLEASAEGGGVGTISMAATGIAKVSDDATPLSFGGSWAGIVSAGPLTVGVDGLTSAVPYGESPPR